MTLRPTVVLAAVLGCLPGAAWPNPTGGAVASGLATIAVNGATLTVSSSTTNAIINWQGFSIAAGETTRFVMPSASSAVLNRVVSATPSAIHGSLIGNGSVFLVNPNGMLFGPTSSVIVGGLTLSTSNITDANFLAGNYNFPPGDASVGIVLNGTIDASLGITINSFNVSSSGGTLTSTGGINVTGPVIAGSGGAVLTGGTVSVGTGTTSSPGSVVLTGGTVNVGTVPSGQIQLAGGTVNVGTTTSSGQLLLTGSTVKVGNTVSSGQLLLTDSTAIRNPIQSQVRMADLPTRPASVVLSGTKPVVGAANPRPATGASVALSLAKRDPAF